MVAHWRKQSGKHVKRRLALNAVGAIAMGLTLSDEVRAVHVDSGDETDILPVNAEQWS